MTKVVSSFSLINHNMLLFLQWFQRLSSAFIVLDAETNKNPLANFSVYGNFAFLAHSPNNGNVLFPPPSLLQDNDFHYTIVLHFSSNNLTGLDLI